MTTPRDMSSMTLKVKYLQVKSSNVPYLYSLPCWIWSCEEESAKKINDTVISLPTLKSIPYVDKDLKMGICWKYFKLILKSFWCSMCGIVQRFFFSPYFGSKTSAEEYAIHLLEDHHTAPILSNMHCISLYVYCLYGCSQTWDLSKTLHRQIFRP